MNQTPIQNKIIEITSQMVRSDIQYSFTDGLLALAQYLKEEIVPEEKPIYRNATNSRDKEIFDRSMGFNDCRSKVVDKFKEMGM
jgi:hypothetical protein